MIEVDDVSLGNNVKLSTHRQTSGPGCLRSAMSADVREIKRLHFSNRMNLPQNLTELHIGQIIKDTLGRPPIIRSPSHRHDPLLSLEITHAALAEIPDFWSSFHTAANLRGLSPRDTVAQTDIGSAALHLSVLLAAFSKVGVPSTFNWAARQTENGNQNICFLYGPEYTSVIYPTPNLPGGGMMEYSAAVESFYDPPLSRNPID